MYSKRLINAASGREPCDIVLKNCRVLNVFTGEIIDGDIGIAEGRIAGIGEYKGKEEKDLEGRYVVPGFINSHVHVESSMVTPQVYSVEELRHGTSTIITDPHEIVNVGGADALIDILNAADECPVNYYIMLQLNILQNSYMVVTNVCMKMKTRDVLFNIHIHSGYLQNQMNMRLMHIMLESKE